MTTLVTGLEMEPEEKELINCCQDYEYKPIPRTLSVIVIMLSTDARATFMVSFYCWAVYEATIPIKVDLKRPRETRR